MMLEMGREPLLGGTGPFSIRKLMFRTWIHASLRDRSTNQELAASPGASRIGIDLKPHDQTLSLHINRQCLSGADLFLSQPKKTAGKIALFGGVFATFLGFFASFRGEIASKRFATY